MVISANPRIPHGGGGSGKFPIAPPGLLPILGGGDGGSGKFPIGPPGSSPMRGGSGGSGITGVPILATTG